RRARLGVERPELGIGLTQRVSVDAGARAHAAIAAAARRARRVPHPLTPSPSGSGGTWRRKIVREARYVTAAVTAKLLLDPIDGGAVAGRALAAIAELRE